ncbi:uncharacterized membrane protein YcgQ (UPF0703/DUF1980 family) [Natronobacillus azotifigens]
MGVSPDATIHKISKCLPKVTCVCRREDSNQLLIMIEIGQYKNPFAEQGIQQKGFVYNLLRFLKNKCYANSCRFL